MSKTMTLKQHVSALKKLLKNHTPKALNDALQQATALDTPKVWELLLEGVGYEKNVARSASAKKTVAPSRMTSFRA